jgi:alpha-1,3-mannosyltransferase
MRVLHITPAYAPAIGGIEKVVGRLAHDIAPYAWDADVAHVATGNAFVREESETGDVWRIPLLGHRIVGLAPRLGDIAAKYDLLHVHDTQLMSITLSSRLWGRGRPMVLSTHGGFHHTSRLGRAKSLHEKLLMPHMLAPYRRILASSNADFDYFGRFSDKVMLAENGVECARFRRIPDAGRTALRWIYWGRLSRNKRVDAAIRVVGDMVRAGFDIDFLITGSDPDGLMADLNGQVEASGLSGHVTIRPPLPDADLDRELAGRGVYITASEYEGFGLSVVEAMAAGLVVLCRDMPPLNGFITEGKTGIFLSFDGSAADTDKLLTLLSSGDEQRAAMSLNAREKADEYSWDRAAPRFADIYRQVLAPIG